MEPCERMEFLDAASGRIGGADYRYRRLWPDQTSCWEDCDCIQNECAGQRCLSGQSTSISDAMENSSRAVCRIGCRHTALQSHARKHGNGEPGASPHDE